MKKVISIIKKVLKIIFVVALIAIGIFAFIFFRQSQNAEAETGQLETEEINYGSLTAAIGATGTVYSRQSAVIAWDASGVVGEVDVSAGDKVSDGQVLAELDQDSLPQNVVQTQADLINYQNQIDDIYEDAVVDEYAVAQKQYDIYTAQQELDDLQKDREKMDWQRCHESTVDTLYADYLLAKDNYQRTLDDYTGNYSWKGEEDLSRAAAKSNLSAAESEYYQCLASWNYCKNKADESEVSDIEADIQMREADIKEYERQLEELKNVKPDLDEIALLEAQIEAAEMTFGLATLESPIGGTITEVLVQEGDIISPGTNAFRIDDISQLLVEVKISEVDINQIKVGHIATLIFDAVYTDEYHGIVSEISSVGESDQGVVEFTVTISLTDASEDIKPGMTATVSIEVDHFENVLLVPNKAVRVVDDERVVYVLSDTPPIPSEELPEESSGFRDMMRGMRGGMNDEDYPSVSMKPVKITLGMRSGAYSIVLDGDLQAGDIIVLNPPSNRPGETSVRGPMIIH